MDKSTNAIAIFNKRAADYQAKFSALDLYHDTFDFFCDSITKPQASVLEIACGPGNITKYLLEKRPDLKILGTDLAPNMIAIAQKNNPLAEFQLMDCREINTLKNTYDALMCGFGLPYLSKDEALQMIADAATILRPGGVAYFSTMEGDYSASGLKKSSDGQDEMFIHYHEAGYLVEALKENGLEIICLKRQDYPEQDATATTDLIIIARMAAKFITFPEKKLIGNRLSMSFSNNKTGDLWRSFMTRRNGIDNGVGTNLYSIQLYAEGFFDPFDPNAVFEKWAAVEVPDFSRIPKGMEPFTLPGGLYAVFHYKGAATQAEETFRYILGTWLPNSGYALDSRPHFEILGEKYRNGDPDSEEDIFIPIRKK